MKVATIVSGTAPTHILRPLLFRLGQDDVLTRLHPRLLQALHSPVAADCLELTMSPQLSEPSGPAYGGFSESATRRLFGSDTLPRLRLMLAIANFCWVRFFRIPPYRYPYLLFYVVQELSPSPEMRSEYGEVTRYLLSIISHRILRAFVRQIDCVVHLLTSKPPVSRSLRVPVSHQSYLGGDILFVRRVVTQCMLPGTPQELSAEAQTLADKVTSSFPTSEGAPGGLLEQCPACGVEIPLADTASAVCSNGHRWCEAFITFNVCTLVLIPPPGHVSSLLCHLIHSGGNHGAHLPWLCAEGLSSCRAISTPTGKRGGCDDRRGSVDGRYRRRPNHGRGPGHRAQARLACTRASKSCASMSLLRK